MAGLQDEQKRQQQGVLSPSGRINRLPNAPQNNPLAHIDPAVRQAGMDLQNRQAATQGRAPIPSALMQRQSPAMQAFAQGAQQQQQWLNMARDANGGTVTAQQARVALGQQGEAARAGLLSGLSASSQVRQAQPGGLSRALGVLPGMRGIRDGLSQLDAAKQSLGFPTQGLLSAGQSRVVVDDIIGRKGAPLPAAQEATQSTQTAAQATPNPQGWGRTAYGDTVVGRKTDNGYAFSNQAADVKAAGNNRFKGRSGAYGRISTGGSFNVMKSEDMWRNLGGSNPLAQLPAAPARYGNAERLAEGLQNIRSNGVNVVKSGADERNAALKLRWQGEELIRQGKNTRRARGGQQMVQAGTAMVNQAAGRPLARADAKEAKAQQGAELASRERMNQGRQALEQAQAASLSQQTQSAQQAEQARQQQAQQLQKMQALMTDPSASPEQRQLAKQFIELATFDPKRYMPLKGADNEYGSGGQFVLDLLTGQPIYGASGGQGGLGAERPPQEGDIEIDPASGRMRQYYKGQWQELRQ